MAVVLHSHVGFWSRVTQACSKGWFGIDAHCIYVELTKHLKESYKKRSNPAGAHLDFWSMNRRTIHLASALLLGLTAAVVLVASLVGLALGLGEAVVLVGGLLEKVSRHQSIAE